MKKRLTCLMVCLVIVTLFLHTVASAESKDETGTSRTGIHVTFACYPSDIHITVYDSNTLSMNGDLTIIEPENDGSYSLSEGTYFYDSEYNGISVYERTEFNISNELTNGKHVIAVCAPFLIDDGSLPQASSEGTVHASAAENYLWPVDDIYGMSRGYYSKHSGIDILTPNKTEVHATKSGTVYISANGCTHYSSMKNGGTSCGCNGGAGNYVQLIHDDGSGGSRYLHLTNNTGVGKGSHINQGGYVGLSGSSGNSTGPHLHFELLSDGTNYKTRYDCNPINSDGRHYASNTSSYNTEKISYIYNIEGSSTGSPYISISGETEPSGDRTQGKGFSLQGIITSFPNLTNVSAQIINTNTGAVVDGFDYSTNPNSASYNIKSDGVDAALKFGNLSVGNYRYIVKATNPAVGTEILIDSPFTVGGGQSVSTGSTMSSGAGQTIPNGNYIIANASNSDFYLDIDGSDVPAEAFTNVHLWTRGDEYPPHDIWTVQYIGEGGFYVIKQLNGEAYLDVLSPANEEGQNVQVWGDTNSDNDEKWSITRNGSGYLIQSKASGFCLTVDGGIAEGNNVTVRKSNGSNEQNWTFIPIGVAMSSGAGQTIPNGNYLISTASDKRYYLDISGTELPAPAFSNVQLYYNSDIGSISDRDIWTVRYVNEGGFYEIKQLNGEAYLDVLSPSVQDGQNVQTWENSDSNFDEKWSIEKSGSNYLIRSKASGFYLTADGSIASGTNVAVRKGTGGTNQNWTFTPWPLTYTVAYNANGGTGAPGNQTKTGGQALTLSGTKPTRSNSSASSFTVTLNPNGGSVSPTSQTAARTTSYTFKNWNTAANGSGTSYNPGASYTANAAVTLYAQWDSSTTTSAVTLPTPIRGGCDFVGWGTSSNATSGITGSYTPSGNVTLYAVWKAKTYPVNYNANGGSGSPNNQLKTHDAALTLSTTKPTRASSSAGSYTVTLNANGGSVSQTSMTSALTTNYTFKNWNTAANGSGTSYNPGASYTANAAVTLYAQWDSSTTTEAVTLPTPTRSGYTFQGWATSSSAASGATGSYTPSANVTLYAIWKANSYYLDLNGSLDGNSVSNITDFGRADIYINGTRVAADYHDYYQQWPTGTRYEVKNIRALEGYKYVGQASYSGTITNQSVGVSLAFVSLPSYTITFDANGGSGAPSSQSKWQDSTVVISSAKPTRNNSVTGSYTVTFNANGGSVSPTSMTSALTTNYTFKNWNTAANGSGTSYNPGASYTANENVTLYAQWNSSTTASTLTLPTPTRSGYTFQGWSTNSSATSGTTDSYTPSGNVTLYAIWQKQAPDFVLPAALNEIGEEAFAGAAFSYVHVPEEVTKIDRRAFADCPNLRNIDIPAETTYIDSKAFEGVSNLTIHGEDGSYAEFYAVKYGFDFVAD